MPSHIIRSMLVLGRPPYQCNISCSTRLAYHELYQITAVSMSMSYLVHSQVRGGEDRRIDGIGQSAADKLTEHVPAGETIAAASGRRFCPFYGAATAVCLFWSVLYWTRSCALRNPTSSPPHLQRLVYSTYLPVCLAVQSGLSSPRPYM